MVAVKPALAVLENTPLGDSGGTELPPRASITPLLTRRLLLPCMYTPGLFWPVTSTEPWLITVPLPPRIDMPRALLPVVVMNRCWSAYCPTGRRWSGPTPRSCHRRWARRC